MKKAVSHFRGNAIAYLALFVALGGTSYAAMSIPRNSVGTRQLRNGAVTANKVAKGSITPTKLGSTIPDYVAFSAEIAQNGDVAHSSTPVTTTGWSTGNGMITFPEQLSRQLPGDCVALASPTGGIFVEGYVEASGGAGGVDVAMSVPVAGGGTGPGPLSVNVALICPR